MKSIHLFTLSMLLCFVVPAQRFAYTFSPAIPDMPLAGWNKMLRMHNGNTLLIHLEPAKAIAITVFNSEHQPVATHRYVCSLLDINRFQFTEFKGLYEINNEAVLFLQQPYNNHLSLFRLRFNASNGAMVKEEVMLESSALANANYCYVTKMAGRDEYAVLIMKDLDRNPDEKTRFTVWNGNHQLVKQTDLAINGRNISSLKLLLMKGYISAPNRGVLRLLLHRLPPARVRMAV